MKHLYKYEFQADVIDGAIIYILLTGYM